MKTEKYVCSLMLICGLFFMNFYGPTNWVTVLSSIFFGLIGCYMIFNYENVSVMILVYFILLMNLIICVYNMDLFGIVVSIILVLLLCYYYNSVIFLILAKLFHNRINKLSLIFCNQAIKSDIKYSQIFKIKGDILLENNDYKGAYEAYYNVFCLDNNAESMNDVAVSLEYLEQYEDALEYYNKSLEIEPHNILSLNNKSILLIKLKQYDEALSNINKVLEIDENNICAIENKEKVLNELND